MGPHTKDSLSLESEPGPVSMKARTAISTSESGRTTTSVDKEFTYSHRMSATKEKSLMGSSMGKAPTTTKAVQSIGAHGSIT